ncbi:MAG TPA: hypothetical protein PKI93_02045 [Alphaproteobacteria bacterium]|nr:hypothetical protein [Alphaproteobacteria bacterium]HNS44918.1 hypothetical protein [Alphaproteobacteria bacterium]
MGQSVKSALWGCLEIPLFMKIGTTRFENTKQATLSSFLIPFLILIPTAEIAHINPEFTDKSYTWLFGSFALLFLISASAFFSASYVAMWALEKRDVFYAYINAFNWMNVSSFAINLPFYLLVYAGFYEFKEMFNLFIFFVLLICAYQAYFITHILKINWMLGTAMSIMGMLSEDMAHKILFGSS